MTTSLLYKKLQNWSGKIIFSIKINVCCILHLMAFFFNRTGFCIMKKFFVSQFMTSGAKKKISLQFGKNYSFLVLESENFFKF